MAPDPKRVTDGSKTLDGGMDAGLDPSLINSNQAAFFGNMTVRGAFPATRPPFRSRLLNFSTTSIQARFTGIFQGSAFYDAENETDNSLIVSLGGKLFRIWVAQNNLVTEITPQVLITVTAVFTVPALNATVLVNVTNETVFTVGQDIIMDGGLYEVLGIFADQINVQYLGGAANTTVVAGVSILDDSSNPISFYATNPATFDFVDIFQAENYMIVLASEHRTIIFDGSRSRQATVKELPSGFVGVYAWGRIWMSLDDKKSFIAGDLVGSASGTAQNNFTDAILKVTENTFLNGGGAFRIPANVGTITGMLPLAAQDSSLGIGPVLVGTERCIVSCNAPVDRTTWQNLTYPIESIPLLGYGPKGPRSFITANSDAWFRSADGIRSLIAARRDFNASQGNTPLSFEVSPILDMDSEALLFYGSAMVFDNRILYTVNPHRLVGGGVSHRGLVAINLDPVSTMAMKDPSVWDGLFTGLEILQVVKGSYGGDEHAFIFSDNSGSVELWELLTEGQGFYDVYETSPAGVDTLTRTPIQSWMETRAFSFGATSQLVKLITAEVFLDQIVDRVTVVVKFKPDQYPLWIPWTTIFLCAGGVTQCDVPVNCGAWQPSAEQYAARLMLTRPPEACNLITGTLVDRGYQFQFRIEITGSCRLTLFKPNAITQRDKQEGDQCAAETACQIVKACETPWFVYSSRGS